MATFVSSIENPKTYKCGSVTLEYSLEKDHLLVKGTMFEYNWDSSFKKAVNNLKNMHYKKKLM